MSTLLFLIGTTLLSLNFFRPSGLAISDWLYFGSLIALVIECIVSRNIQLPSQLIKPLFWPIVLIVCGGMISMAHSDDLKTARMELIQQVYAISLFVFLIFMMIRREKTEIIISAFIFSGLFTAAVAVWDFSFKTEYGPLLSAAVDGQLWGRFAGTLRHPNKFGYYLTLTSLLTIHKIIRTLLLRKKLALGLFSFSLMVQVFGIYLSGSMTAYIGILVGLFLVIFSYLYTVNRLLSLATCLSAFVLILASFLILTNFHLIEVSVLDSSMLGSSIQRVFSETSISRLEIYQGAFAYILKNPFVGTGYDQISTSGIADTARKLSSSIHNVLLQVWYVGGIFSFLGWLLIYCKIGAQAVKNLYHTCDRDHRSPIRAISFAALAAIIMDQFQDPIYQREKWLVFGLLLAMNSL